MGHAYQCPVILGKCLNLSEPVSSSIKWRLSHLPGRAVMLHLVQPVKHPEHSQNHDLIMQGQWCYYLQLSCWSFRWFSLDFPSSFLPSTCQWHRDFPVLRCWAFVLGEGKKPGSWKVCKMELRQPQPEFSHPGKLLPCPGKPSQSWRAKQSLILFEVLKMMSFPQGYQMRQVPCTFTSCYLF